MNKSKCSISLSPSGRRATAFKVLKTLFICIGAIPLLSDAIVIRHDVRKDKYDATASDFPPLATLYSIGVHGTLIHPEWVVTAAHAIFCMEPGQQIIVGNEVASVAARYSHRKYVLGEKNDIALIKLDKPVTSVAPAKLFKQSTEKGMITWFIGAGGTGTGDKGETLGFGENKGKLRKAQNRITEIRGSDIVFKFEKGAEGLPLEGVSGNGDSGGPAYIVDDNGYTLIGVSSRTGSMNFGVGQYGVTELYTRISSYTGWIERIISADNESERHELSTQNRFLQPGMDPVKMPEICSSIGMSLVNTGK